MLGLSMVVLLCSVPACTPFLIADGAFVADNRVCDLDITDGREGRAILVDSELEVEETALVRDASSASEIDPEFRSSGTFKSSGAPSAILSPSIVPVLWY